MKLNEIEIFSQTSESCHDWQQNPSRLVSLMELLHLRANAFCHVMSLLGQTLAYLDHPVVQLPDNASYEAVIKMLGRALGQLEAETEKLGLGRVHQQLTRIDSLISSDVINPIELRRLLGDLAGRIIDELETLLFLQVPFSRASYYEQQKPLFGSEVIAKFPRMTEDISEAGKCFALGRYTASVFHLMRIMEVGVQEFGNKIGVVLAKELNWQKILNEINKPIKAMGEKKDPLAKVYAEVAAHLYNVKLAWRNEVMHPKETYMEEEAEDIFRNVKTFMSDLAQLI
jgi:hypothetical protein